jgi:hypothetical protein
MFEAACKASGVAEPSKIDAGSCDDKSAPKCSGSDCVDNEYGGCETGEWGGGKSFKHTCRQGVNYDIHYQETGCAGAVVKDEEHGDECFESNGRYGRKWCRSDGTPMLTWCGENKDDGKSDSDCFGNCMKSAQCPTYGSSVIQDTTKWGSDESYVTGLIASHEDLKKHVLCACTSCGKPLSDVWPVFEAACKASGAAEPSQLDAGSCDDDDSKSSAPSPDSSFTDDADTDFADTDDASDVLPSVTLTVIVSVLAVLFL